MFEKLAAQKAATDAEEDVKSDDEKAAAEKAAKDGLPFRLSS